jgi:hypothetical protein
MDKCCILGCENKYKAKGFCRYHYENNRRHGDPLKTKTLRRSPGTRTRDDIRERRRLDYKKTPNGTRKTPKTFTRKTKKSALSSHDSGKKKTQKDGRCYRE